MIRKNVLAGKRPRAGALWQWFNLSSYLDWHAGEGCQGEGPGLLRAGPGLYVLWIVHGCVVPGNVLRVMSLHLCKGIHVSAPGCAGGGSCCKPPSCPACSLLSPGSKKGLLCRACLLFAIIWQVALCEAAELKRCITLMQPLMSVGYRALSG